ncbi:SDR family NAD(P)-dependent oxidoreductase [Agromyces aerolatus]|uniref:SDR family NAD(P)-dependent oxidoreductase n=1 Tax=Agromyces sp. LY-1074 TaxID=3074080 RepID=UPI0028567ABF|nr:MULTISPECIES: SDR family NAD(P)-dependent oxidoreductase [unclassified Agromyces]MDR5701644.1 SDR family NAD(P)-dependent oxidoreductase [Agromyces sp. LY-1074]MDR5707916.1 SDR family NAD(P)-dependent oxidoreductase [Agromyces sp. LY-1358]
MTLTEPLPLGDLLSLRDRTAVVTGSAEGIGAGIARRLAEAGAHVVIADRNLDGAEATAAELRAAGGSAEAIGLDVLEPASFDDLASVLREAGRVPTVWVNNAGAYPKRSALDLTVDEWDRMLDINVRSTFLGAQLAARMMSDAGLPGVILNMSSIAGVRLAPANPIDYAAAKAGVAMLTRNLGVELGPLGIRVVGLAPGFVVTPGVTRTPGVSARIGNPASIPALGRQMDADDVARVALFLVSDMASMISSEIVVVDGGGAWNLETPTPARP